MISRKAPQKEQNSTFSIEFVADDEGKLFGVVDGGGSATVRLILRLDFHAKKYNPGTDGN